MADSNSLESFLLMVTPAEAASPEALRVATKFAAREVERLAGLPATGDGRFGEWRDTEDQTGAAGAAERRAHAMLQKGMELRAGRLFEMGELMVFCGTEQISQTLVRNIYEPA